jgi:ATP-binding cassette subfamily B protein
MMLTQSITLSTKLISQIISSLVMIVGVVVMMLSISWLLTVVAILILPLSLISIRQITKRSQPQFAQTAISFRLSQWTH